MSEAHYRGSKAALSLGDTFSDPVEPARFPERILRFRNDRWASRVGLAHLANTEWERHFARFSALPDSLVEPLALRYHGHQFQTYNKDLGDGRGFLFAQLYGDDDRLLDLGTKGSGRTPYSRGGDGRLTLKGGFREVLATEMLEALGVYTSKSFSLYETGERLERHDEPSPTRSSVLVRLSHSHVRFGTFQRLRYLHDNDGTRHLVEYCVTHFYPDLMSAEDVPLAFFRKVVERSAELAASWMAAGFVHGVLNTDNLSITGESFDYGPWRFLPHYDPRFTAAYFDETGLYAYARQPDVVLWNLERLRDCLVPLSPSAAWDRALVDYPSLFRRAFHARFLARLGVRSAGEDHDRRLVDLVYGFLEERTVTFGRFFFDWYGGEASRERARHATTASHYRGDRFEELERALAFHEPSEPERLSHPYFARARPCDMLVDEVEALWREIAEIDDWSSFEWKIADVRRMGDALGLATKFGRWIGSPTSVTG